MTFMSETSKKIPAGDTPPKAPDSAGAFTKSDLPGFVNPVVNGEPNHEVYIPEQAAGTEDAPSYNREEAEGMTKKGKRSAADVLYGEAK